MSTSQSSYDRILVPTDGSPGTARAVVRGLDLARTFDADVHVLYVVDVRPYEGVSLADEEALEEAAVEAGRRALTDVRERAAGFDLDRAVTQATRIGVPHAEILEYAEENDVDLIAMGTHGRTGSELAALGSTAERVLRAASVPVLTVRLTGREDDPGEAADAPYRYDDVLVPTDGSEAAVRAAEHAVGIASRYDATIHALYVVDTSVFEFEDAPRSILGPLREGGRNAVDEVEAIASDGGVPVRAHVAEGTPHREIVDRADQVEADLLAMGTRGRAGLPEVLLGSTTARVVRTARAPVLSVR